MIPTHRKSVQLLLTIEAEHPLVLGIKAEDPLHPFSHYLRRKVPFKSWRFGSGSAVRELKLPFPVTPETLALEIEAKNPAHAEAFRVSKVSVEPLPAPAVWADEERHRFMNFAIDFAQKAGYVSPGFYHSPAYEFLIHYMDTIRDPLGNSLVTPARIHRKMPRVQLSQDLFQRYSIPVRVAILSHEACHFFLNTRSETTADLCGIRYYLDAGFPSIEAVYATTQVFGMHPGSIGATHVERTRDIIDFIDHYKKVTA